MCVGPAIGASDSVSVYLSLIGKFGETVQAECVKAWQELGLAGVVVVRFRTDATGEEFMGVSDV